MMAWRFERAMARGAVRAAHQQVVLFDQLHSSLAAGKPPHAGMDDVLLAPEPPLPDPALADPEPLPDPEELLDPVDPDPAPMVP
jgi:hypothetical protein